MRIDDTVLLAIDEDAGDGCMQFFLASPRPKEIRNSGRFMFLLAISKAMD